MMQVIDGVIWWIGAFTLLTGGVGAMSTLAVWAINQTIELLGYKRTLLQIYWRYLEEKRSKDSIPA